MNAPEMNAAVTAASNPPVLSAWAAIKAIAKRELSA